jgi:tetratricopeptide (TPR) repeat protein
MSIGYRVKPDEIASGGLVLSYQTAFCLFVSNFVYLSLLYDTRYRNLLKDLVQIALFTMDCKDADQRLVAIGKELEKNLNNSEAWAAKADILCSMGMHEIAIRCCDRSLAIDPDNALTWMTRGDALKKLGKHDEAQTAFARALELGYTK